MEKCRSCQFFDRNNAATKESKATQWGQCRRAAPVLSPLNQKPHMIEGVWPHVRDDDWCGEWRTEVQRPAERVAELLNGTTPIHRPKVTALTTGANAMNGSAGDD